jgi:hypothetical protein
MGQANKVIIIEAITYHKANADGKRMDRAEDRTHAHTCVCAESGQMSSHGSNWMSPLASVDMAAILYLLAFFVDVCGNLSKFVELVEVCRHLLQNVDLLHANVLSHKTQGNLHVAFEAASALNFKILCLEDRHILGFEDIIGFDD